jgi:hypothetical protein
MQHNVAKWKIHLSWTRDAGHGSIRTACDDNGGLGRSTVAMWRGQIETFMSSPASGLLGAQPFINIGPTASANFIAGFAVFTIQYL